MYRINMQDTVDNLPMDIWQRAIRTYLSTLSSDESRSQAERLFSMVSSVSLNGNDEFKVLTRNEYSREVLQRDYQSQMIRCLTLVTNLSDPVKLSFEVDENSQSKIVIAEPEEDSHTHVSTFISTMPLNENYTFDEFVQGPSNSWAYAAANGVVKHPGEKGYNPLFIHGGTGLGKTHLMQAIGNEIRRTHPSISVCYLTAEVFLNEYINSLSNKGIDLFREKYRKVDVLLVDDVQFFQKGKQCQDEFFNTFNALISKQKQIVMTSDVAPKDLSVLEERLISRFEGGMVQEIESPSYETRLAILRKKAEGLNAPIQDSAIKFIAEHIKSHVRAMEGALGKVKIMMMIDPNIELTDDMLSRLLKDFIAKEKMQRNVTIEEIQSTVANEFGISISQMISTDKTATLVTPRQMAMYVTRKFTTKSLQEMTKKFNKTHATILHGVKNITKRIETEEDLSKAMERILEKLGYTNDDRVD